MFEAIITHRKSTENSLPLDYNAQDDHHDNEDDICDGKQDQDKQREAKPNP
jgi:hypothetical protein